MEKIEFYRAQPRDVGLIRGILNESAAWLRSERIDQWPARFSEEYIADLVACDFMYVAALGSEKIGVYALQWADRTHWEDAPEASGYVHTMAVRRTLSGQGLGHRVLRDAENRAREAEREYLRATCRVDNAFICGYLEREGFESKGQSNAEGQVLIRYQKKLA